MQEVTYANCCNRGLRPYWEQHLPPSFIDRSLTLIDSIPDNLDRDRVLEDISEILTKSGDIDRSLTVANSISDKEIKDRPLRNISFLLAERDDIEESFKVANSISCERFRYCALKKDYRTLSQAPRG